MLVLDSLYLGVLANCSLGLTIWLQCPSTFEFALNGCIMLHSDGTEFLVVDQLFSVVDKSFFFYPFKSIVKA